MATFELNRLISYDNESLLAELRHRHACRIAVPVRICL